MNPQFKILHLLSNWKWTERSEPVVDLALAQQDLGAHTVLVCDKGPDDSAVPNLATLAREKGLQQVVPLSGMSKHFTLASFPRSVYGLRTVLNANAPDVIHCHMRNAHLLAGLAHKRKITPLFVRTVYDPENIPRDFRNNWCFKHCTHGIVVVTEKAKQSSKQRSVPERNIEVIEPGIDVQRFSPKRPLKSEIRFNLPADLAFVAGMITRIRKTRRLDVPLKAIKLLNDAYHQLRLLLVGRGSEGAYESVVDRPASEMGIRDRIIPVGYCQGDELVAALRSMDVLLYPIPGTDKTCRTVREALAAGVPVIAPRIGFLPQLIEDNANGRLVDLKPESFAQALKDLMDSPKDVQRLSKGAIESAQRFNLATQAEKTLQFYARLMQAHSSVVK